MNKYIIAIFLIIILLIVFNNNKAILDNFIDTRSSSTKTCYSGTGDFPSHYKIGEISKENKIDKSNYYEYLNKLHNSHSNNRILKYNYGCNDCQRLNN